MADKPTLIVVHGMGIHTGQSFHKEITEALDYALSLYPNWNGKKINDLVNIVPFGYDDIFNSQIWGSSTEIEELEQFYSAKFRFTQPGVKLTYSRSFGNQKAKVNRRASAADEERKRVE